MDTPQVPADIMKIAEFLARNAKMSGGAMKWNEEAKFKASLMNERDRWARSRVTPEMFEAQCREVGLPEDDVATVGDFLRKAQSGRRLVAHKSYQEWTFGYDYGRVI